MADGTTPYVFYNGVPDEEMRSGYGLLKNGMENVKPILTRAIYIDLAAFKGVATFRKNTRSRVADVRGALAQAGIEGGGHRARRCAALQYRLVALWPDARRPTPAIPPTQGAR